MNSGAASAIVTLSKEAGVPLARDQKSLTPFQRMVLVKEFKRRQEKREEEMEDARRGGTSGIQNSHPKAPSSPGGQMGGGESDTVEFINEGATDG